MPTAPRRAWPGFLATLVLASLVFCFFFNSLMLRPNRVAPTFGGDGLTIHYNLQYHATYGHGTALRSQYHPHAESIFLTDAQGVVAVVLSWLRPLFPGIGGYATGVSNALIFWSNPLAAALLFLVLRRLGVRPWLSGAGGILIALMAPQILRQLNGHYALGYAWLLPLLLLYLLAEPGRRHWLRSLGVGAVLTVLGLNNPYLLLIGVAFLLACAGVAAGVALAGRRAWWPRVAHWAAVALGSTALLFLLLSAGDGAADRVAVPFGFFKNHTHWSGLATSPFTFARPTVSALFHFPERIPAESWTYFGLVPWLLLVGLAMALLLPRARARLVRGSHPLLPVLFGGAVLCLLFSFALPFQWFEDWSYDHLSSILQFRAPARFAWPQYYLVGCCAVYGLDRLFTRLRVGRPALAWAVLLLPLGVWAYEAGYFLRRATHDHIHGNALRPENLEGYGRLAQEHSLGEAEYQGIYLLPAEAGWSDKVHLDYSWRANHDGYRLSLATGLPLVNGKLSRVSLGHSLAALQLVSDPLVERELLNELDPDRDLLLLASREDSLQPGERFLLELGEVVHRDERVELRRLPPAAVRAATAAARVEPAPPGRYVWLDPEEDTRAPAFAGAGARHQPAGNDFVWDVKLDSFPPGSELEFSFWTWADPTIYGGPKFTFHVRNTAAESLLREQRWINRTLDTQAGWLRTALRFTVPEGAVDLIVKGDYFHEYFVDAALLREAGAGVRTTSGERTLLNGFRIP